MMKEIGKVVYRLLPDDEPNPSDVIELFMEMYDRFEGRADLQQVIYESMEDFAERYGIEPANK